MSQSYSHQNYPHTPANRFSPPDRHQPYDSYGFQTQTNTRTSSVLIQQHAQSRPGAISPIQRERRPLPSPEMHGHHARASAALHSTTLPKLPASQLRGDAFVSSSQPRPLPPHRTMTTDSSSSPEPRLGQHVASNTGRKPLPHPPSTVSQTIAASINASGSLSAPLIQGGSRPESVLPSLNVGVDTSFSPRIVVLASPAGSSSLPSSPVKESGLSFTPLWKQHKRVTQSNGATSPQVVAPRRALPTPVPRANADTSVNAYNQLANSSADMSHHMLLARSKTINSFGSSLPHIPLVDSSEVTRIPSSRALHHPPQSPVSSWARSVRFGPVGSLESDLERPPPVPPRPRLSELSDETSDIRTNPVENPEPPAAKSPPLPLRPRSTDPPEIREPTPKSALPTILDATDGSIIGGEAAPISLFRSLKGKEKEDYPEEVDSDPLTQPSEKIATFPFQGDAGGSPEAVHPHDFSNLNTEVTEDITHTTERRDVDRPSHTVTNISAQSNARAPRIKRMTLPVIPTKKPSITPPVPGRASNPTPSVHFSRPHEPQSMAMRLATQALAEENRARSQQYLPQRSPVVQYDNGYDEEDSDSPSEFDEPVSPVAQLPSISISVDESNSDLTTPSSVPEIRRLGAQPPTSEPYSKSSLHEIEDVVSISIPIPQLSFSNDDETGANSNVVDPQYRSSITFSPTPSAGARVRKEVPAPSRSVDGGVFPNIIPGTNLRCAGCRSPIVGRTVSAMNQRWHPACFKCVIHVIPIFMQMNCFVEQVY